MSKGYKGGDFEREIAKRLSLWWSRGLTGKDRDDIFWRSSQSGGRATQRSKSGKSTYGSYGDLSAVDPIGEPLIRMFTIELKRGSSHGCPGDLLDFKVDNGSHPWVKCLMQAVRSHEQAGSAAWMLICRRDHRLPVVFLEARILKFLRNGEPIVGRSNMMRFHLQVKGQAILFVGLLLESFLASITPQQIISASKNLS